MLKTQAPVQPPISPIHAARAQRPVASGNPPPYSPQYMQQMSRTIVLQQPPSQTMGAHPTAPFASQQITVAQQQPITVKKPQSKGPPPPRVNAGGGGQPSPSPAISVAAQPQGAALQIPASAQPNLITPPFSAEQQARRSKILAEKLNAAIHFDKRDVFNLMIQKGVDINYSDDETNPPIFSAILNCNDWALENLLAVKKGLLDVNKWSTTTVTPLYIACRIGNEYAIDTLIRAGADPKTFCGATALHKAVIGLSSYSILENSIWNDEVDPRIGGENTKLKEELRDFFFQRKNYAEKIPGQGIPFQATTKPLHVYHQGKREIVGLLLSKGVQPELPNLGGYSVIQFLQKPSLYAKEITAAQEEEIRYLRREGDVLIYEMKFHNRASDAPPIDIIVYYNIAPIKKQILGYVQNKNTSADERKEIVESFSRVVQDVRADVTIEHHKMRLGHERLQQHTELALHDAHVAQREAYLAQQHAQAANDQAHQANHKVSRLEVRVDNLELALQSLAIDIKDIKQITAKLDKYLANDLQLKALVDKAQSMPHTAQFFNNGMRFLYGIFTMYHLFATGLIDPKDPAVVAVIDSIAGFISKHVPAPFGAAVDIINIIAKQSVRQHEKERYKTIDKVLPVDLIPLISNIMVKLLTFIDKKIPVAKLDLKQMKEMGETVLAVTAFPIFHINEVTAITSEDDFQKMRDQERISVLTNHILDVIQFSGSEPANQKKQSAWKNFQKALGKNDPGTNTHFLYDAIQKITKEVHDRAHVPLQTRLGAAQSALDKGKGIASSAGEVGKDAGAAVFAQVWDATNADGQAVKLAQQAGKALKPVATGLGTQAQVVGREMLKAFV